MSVPFDLLCTLVLCVPSELIAAAGVDDWVHAGVDPAQPGHHSQHRVRVLKREMFFFFLVFIVLSYIFYGKIIQLARKVSLFFFATNRIITTGNNLTEKSIKYLVLIKSQQF